MDEMMKKYIRFISEEGFGVGHLFTDGVHHGYSHEYVEHDSCTGCRVCSGCRQVTPSLHNESHVCPIPIVPKIDDYNDIEDMDYEKDEILQRVKDQFPFEDHMSEDEYEEFDPHECTLEELCSFPEFEDLLCQELNDSWIWYDHLKKDYTQTARSAVWHVHPRTSVKTNWDEEDSATMMYHLLGSMVYLMEWGNRTKPSDLGGSRGLLLTDSGSRDGNRVLAGAYLLCGQCPPLDVLRPALDKTLDSSETRLHPVLEYMMFIAAKRAYDHVGEVQGWIRRSALNMQEPSTLCGLTEAYMAELGTVEDALMLSGLSYPIWPDRI